jgi:hypothetical protein
MVDTTTVYKAKDPLKETRPKDYDFRVAMEWTFAGGSYNGDVRIFKTSQYSRNGFVNSAEWYIAVKGLKQRYAEVRLTLDGAKELCKKLLAVLFYMDPSTNPAFRDAVQSLDASPPTDREVQDAVEQASDETVR